MTGPAIQTERLSKDYGAGRGLFDLDLEIESGVIFGFLGPDVSPLYYHSGHDPLAAGVHLADLGVLAAASAALTAFAMAAIGRRDLRG